MDLSSNPGATPRVEQAIEVWSAGLAAVRPSALMPIALRKCGHLLEDSLRSARRILVVGAGKASAAMAEALEIAFAAYTERIHGLVAVPDNACASLKSIRLQRARPAGQNEPTPEAMAATEEMIERLAGAGRTDLAMCLLSGGGSALMTAPVAGVTLRSKQEIVGLLQARGASIGQLNAVRKHLSRVKGGRLAEVFSGRALFTLILSDVIGDPLDVIASGPTAPDPTTYADALEVLERYDLMTDAPHDIVTYLQEGAAGKHPETPKNIPENVHNLIIGNNADALGAAAELAKRLGFNVLNLGSFIQGETEDVAACLAGIVRSIQTDGVPVRPPACVLSGGETVVTLGKDHGRGGRNQEFTLATAVHLGELALQGCCVICAGTDGEDGPTDAAGAWVNNVTWSRAKQLGLSPSAYLRRHASYEFFDAVGGIFRTGLTQVNVMDLRVMLIA